jgi:serine/threonine-protein kinase
MIGKQIGPYDVLEVIGRGGMGVIYKARDRALDRVVALKFLKASSAMDEEAKQRFLREARSLAKLDHPNIPRIYNVGKADETYYIACQYIEGRTVLDVLGKRKMFAVHDALRIVRDVAAALEATHSHGIIHRDIKTENLMLDESGGVKVLDFGLAKPMEGGTRITRTDVYLGTPEYCSPEQLRGEKLDERSDLYSLGVVLYELLVGELPFRDDDISALYQRIFRGKFESVRKVRPGIPGEVDALVRALIEKRREHRLGSASEVVARIDAILGDNGSGSGPVRIIKERKPPRRHAPKRPGIFHFFFAVAGVLLVPAAVVLTRLLRG